MARIGPSRAAIISNFEPVVSVLAAAFILGEELSAGSIAGGLLILCSLIVLAVKKREKRRASSV
jgi:drug/metabolite transporter (DMT)-like permease